MKKIYFTCIFIFFISKSFADSFTITSSLNFGSCTAGSGVSLGSKQATIRSSDYNSFTYNVYLDKTNLPTFVSISGGGIMSPGATVLFTVTCTAPPLPGTYNIKIPYKGDYTINTGSFTDVLGELTITIIAAAPIIPLPSAPSNLTGTTYSTSQCNLSWTSSSGTVTGYNIYQNINGTLTKIQTVTTNIATVNNLTAATTYAFQVSAYNSGGESAKSNLFTITTLVLDAPTNCRATFVDCDIANLSWDAPSGNVTGYTVSTFSPETVVAITNSTTVQLIDLLPNTITKIHIRAYNAQGTGASATWLLKTAKLCAKSQRVDSLNISFDKINLNKPINVTLLPNPVINQLFIKGINNFDVTIFDLNGKMLKQKVNVNDYIDISDLKAGMYIIHMKNDNNLVVRKFLKQ